MLIRILVSTCLLIFLQSQVMAQSQKTIPREPPTPSLKEFPERKKDTPPDVTFPTKKWKPLRFERATQACLNACKARFMPVQQYKVCKFKCYTKLKESL
jgi:hypothetical protein